MRAAYLHTALGVRISNSKRIMVRRMRLVTFHCFTMATEEVANGVLQYPSAIIEMKCGRVEVFPAEFIQFVKPVIGGENGSQ